MSRDIRIFLGGITTGSPASRERHLFQAEHIYSAILKRWGQGEPEYWKVKYLRWFLNEQLKTASSETRYRYWLTTKLIIERLGKTKNWLPHVNGPWTQRTNKKT